MIRIRLSIIIAVATLLSQLRGYGQCTVNPDYPTTDGLDGAALKTELFNLINGHNTLSYSGLWTAYFDTDIDPEDNFIWDMYSENPGGADPYNYTPGTDQCGNFSNEGDCYNREHSFPKSWFNDASPMFTDIFHVVPTDGRVNGLRSNFPYGPVASDDSGSPTQNGSRRGPLDQAWFTSSPSFPYTGTVFEPIDEYKGDFARIYFYMATRYENLIAGWENNSTQSDAVLDGSSFPVFEDWQLEVLLRWHESDPVSQKEIDRNNVICDDYQGNRNPFADRPELVNRIWGSGCSGAPSQDASGISITDITSGSFTINWTPGDGSNRLVIMREGSAVSFAPSDGTTYSGVSSDFSMATDQDADNNRIVFDGSGSSVEITGLGSNTTYFVEIYEFCFDGPDYRTAGTQPTASATTTVQAPANPSGFETSTISSSQINLSWNLNGSGDDIVLVRNTDGVFTAPTNGNPPGSLGTPLANGTIIAKGTGVIFNDAGLSPGTQYFYKIFSVGTGNIYSLGVELSAFTVFSLPLLQDFSNCANLNGWTTFSVTDDDDVWTCGSGYFDINGFGGGADEDWLIAPPLDFSGSTSPTISFNTQERYEGPDLELLYSTNYTGSGDPNTASWTTIPVTLNDVSSGASFSSFTSSGDIDVSTISASRVFFALRYTGTGSSGTTENWRVDDVLIQNNSATVNNPSSFTVSSFTPSSISFDITANVASDEVVVVFDNGGDGFGTPAGAPGMVGGSLGGDEIVFVGTAASFTHSGLTAGTTYQYKAYSYDMSNQYSSGILLSATTTNALDYTVYETAIGTNPLTNGWSSFSVSGVGQEWTYDGSNSIGMNAYDGGCQANEDWLISPPFDLDSYDNEEISLALDHTFNSTDLVVQYSNDYVAGENPNSYTWTTINTYTTGDQTESGLTDLQGVTGKAVYIGFQYTDNDASCALWELTSFSITAVTEGGSNISGFSPNAGTAGTRVTISGSNFALGSGVTSVQFNGTEAASFNVLSDNTIEAVVPAGATDGALTVVVDGISNNSSSIFNIFENDASGCSGGGPAPTISTEPNNAFACEPTDAVQLTVDASGPDYQWKRFTTGGSGITIFQETFETDGEGVRYTSTTSFNSGSNDHFQRTDGTDISNVTSSYSNQEGTFFWAGEDTDNDGINPVFLVISGIDITNYTNIRVQALYAAGNENGPGSGAYDLADQFRVFYNVDGGGDMNGIWFSYEDHGDDFNEPIGLDADFDGISDVNGSNRLSTVFQDFEFSIPTTGNSLSLTFQISMTSDKEEIAFDNIRVIGDLDGWENITDAGVFSGSSTNTLSVSDASALDDVQFYVEVSDGSNCFTPSQTVQLEVLDGTGTPGKWVGRLNDFDWDGCANWENGVVPDQTIDVTIGNLSGNTIVVPDGATVNSLDLGAGASLEVAAGGSLTVFNDLTVNNSAVLTGADASSKMVIDDGVSPVVHDIIIQPELTGTLDIEISTDTLVRLISDNLKIGGNTFTVLSGTFDFNGFNITGTGTFNFSGVTSTDTLVITSPDGIDQSGSTGNIQTATINLDNSGVYKYSGVIPQITGTGLPTSATKVVFDNSSEEGVTLSVDLTGSKAVEIRQGTLVETENNTINDGGVVTIRDEAVYEIRSTGTIPGVNQSGTLTMEEGSFLLLSGNDQELRGSRTYENITFNGSGTATLTSSLTALNGTIAILSGTVDLENRSMAGSNAGGTLTMTGGTLISSGTGTFPEFDPAMGGQYNLSGGTIEFANSQATEQTVRNLIYNNVDITGTNVGISDGDITVRSGGTFAIRSGASFRMNSLRNIVGQGSFVLEAGGSLGFASAQGIVSDGSGGNIQLPTITLDPAANYVIENFGSDISFGNAITTANNITVEKQGDNLSLSQDITITGALTFASSATPIVTGTNSIHLGPAAMVSENGTGYVLGQLSTTRNVDAGASENFGGMGVTIANPVSGLGNVSVVRTTTDGSVGAAEDLATGEDGIGVKWSVEPTTPPAEGEILDLTLSWNSNLDNSKDITNMQVWNSDDGVTWVLVQNVGDLSGTDPRTVTIQVDDFSEYTLTDDVSPLPVEFFEFSAQVEENSVLLTWITATEIDNAGFYVQRSLDGETFLDLGFVEGAGNSQQLTNYRFNTEQVHPVAYYRLKQMDYNGLFDFSKILAVQVVINFEDLFKIFPVPFDQSLEAQPLQPFDDTSRFHLVVSSSAGEVLLNAMVESYAVESTLNEVLRNSRSGHYFITIQLGGQLQVTRLVKSR